MQTKCTAFSAKPCVAHTNHYALKGQSITVTSLNKLDRPVFLLVNMGICRSRWQLGVWCGSTVFCFRALPGRGVLWEFVLCRGTGVTATGRCLVQSRPMEWGVSACEQWGGGLGPGRALAHKTKKSTGIARNVCWNTVFARVICALFFLFWPLKIRGA